MAYHPLVNQIIGLLTLRGLWFETFSHPPVRTSEEAAKVRTGYSFHQGTKALIVKIKDKTTTNNAMLVIPGDRKFDPRLVRLLFNSGSVSFSPPQEIAKITGDVLPGGIPPFGNLFHLNVYLDPEVLENEKIIFNAGDRSFSVAMYSADYLELVQPKIVKICQS